MANLQSVHHSGAALSSGSEFQISSAGADLGARSLPETLSSLAADVGFSRVGDPSRLLFVGPDGQLNSTSMRTFLLDSAFRAEQDFRLGRDSNPLSNDSMVMIAGWATGLVPGPGQSFEDYSVPRISGEGMVALVERYGEPFAAALIDQLDRLGEGVSSEKLEGSPYSISDVIERDPIGVCILLVDRISPYEGAGANRLPAALNQFREICRQTGVYQTTAL